MKKIWISICTFAIILTFCFFEIFAVDNTFQSFDAQLLKIESEIKQDNFEKALVLYENLEKKWGKDQVSLSLFLEHLKLEYISQSAIALKINLEEQIPEEALIEAAKIREYLNTIKNSAAPHLYNIM